MSILHWLTREEDLLSSGRAPYRLLEHVETYGDANTENMLIQGDNLDGLIGHILLQTVRMLWITIIFKSKKRCTVYVSSIFHSSLHGKEYQGL